MLTRSLYQESLCNHSLLMHAARRLNAMHIVKSFKPLQLQFTNACGEKTECNAHHEKLTNIPVPVYRKAHKHHSALPRWASY